MMRDMEFHLGIDFADDNGIPDHCLRLRYKITRSCLRQGTKYRFYHL
jgi:hypothetical protein